MKCEELFDKLTNDKELKDIYFKIFELKYEGDKKDAEKYISKVAMPKFKKLNDIDLYFDMLYFFEDCFSKKDIATIADEVLKSRNAKYCLKFLSFDLPCDFDAFEDMILKSNDVDSILILGIDYFTDEERVCARLRELGRPDFAELCHQQIELKNMIFATGGTIDED